MRKILIAGSVLVATAVTGGAAQAADGDVLNAPQGNDILVAPDGNDVLIAPDGNDVLMLPDGYDTL